MQRRFLAPVPRPQQSPFLQTAVVSTTGAKMLTLLVRFIEELIDVLNFGNSINR